MLNARAFFSKKGTLGAPPAPHTHTPIHRTRVGGIPACAPHHTAAPHSAPALDASIGAVCCPRAAQQPTCCPRRELGTPPAGVSSGSPNRSQGHPCGAFPPWSLPLPGQARWARRLNATPACARSPPPLAPLTWVAHCTLHTPSTARRWPDRRACPSPARFTLEGRPRHQGVLCMRGRPAPRMRRACALMPPVFQVGGPRRRRRRRRCCPGERSIIAPRRRLRPSRAARRGWCVK
jgi:hypothetical protein